MQSKAERTKQFIIEKSAVLFNEKGYAGTSLSDIIDATGLTKGCIYGHFESKEDIALSAFEYASANIIAMIGASFTPELSALDKIRNVLKFYNNYLNHPAIKGGCPLINTSIEADDTNPLLRERVVKVLNKVKKGITKILQEGIEKGEFKPDINTESFAYIFIAMIQGGIMLSKAYDNQEMLDIITSKLDQMIQSELMN